MNKKYSQIVVRLREETERKLRKIAEKSQMTKAAWVRQLIIREIDKK
jgi:predicted DNA-binding protein